MGYYTLIITDEEDVVKLHSFVNIEEAALAAVKIVQLMEMPSALIHIVPA